MAYKNNIRTFSILLGYIRIAMEFDSFKDVRGEYHNIMNTIAGWANDYTMNKNFNNITHQESLKIHKLIDNIREQKLFDKNIGNESEISDEILIWYEVLIKSINEEMFGGEGIGANRK